MRKVAAGDLADKIVVKGGFMYKKSGNTDRFNFRKLFNDSLRIY